MSYEMTRASMEQSLVARNIPPGLRYGLIEWVVNATPPGHFIGAVVDGDLFLAFAHADDGSAAAMKDLVMWFYNETPGTSHGRGALKSWQGMEGVE